VQTCLKDHGWPLEWRTLSIEGSILRLDAIVTTYRGEQKVVGVRFDFAYEDCTRLWIERLVVELVQSFEKELEQMNVPKRSYPYRIVEVLSEPANSAGTKWTPVSRNVLYEGADPRDFLRQHGRQLGQIGGSFPKKMELVLQRYDAGSWRSAELTPSIPSMLSVPKGPRQIQEHVTAHGGTFANPHAPSPLSSPTPWEMGRLPSGRMPPPGRSASMALPGSPGVTIDRALMPSARPVARGPMPGDLLSPALRSPPTQVQVPAESSEEAALRHMRETQDRERKRQSEEQLREQAANQKRRDEAEQSVLSVWREKNELLNRCTTAWKEAALFELDAQATRAQQELLGDDSEVDARSKWSLAEQEARKLLEFAQARVEEARARREGRDVGRLLEEGEDVRVATVEVEENYTEDELAAVQARASEEGLHAAVAELKKAVDLGVVNTPVVADAWIEEQLRRQLEPSSPLLPGVFVKDIVR
jgi:hypothetical protein